MTLTERLNELASELAARLRQVTDPSALEQVRIEFLGRSGKITEIRRGIGKLAPDERPTAGKVINDAVVGF